MSHSKEGMTMENTDIIPVVLTIAGSDSGGGAGIEADIKTFGSLYVHGTCAITSVTSQNTTGVQGAYDLPPEVVCEQIRSVCSDMDIRWAKTGMLSSAEITSSVAKCVKENTLSLVIDPVMAAEAGGELLKKDALSTLKEELVPLSYVITPNIAEAEALSGIKIEGEGDAIKAAKAIASMGAKNVIITGGHLDATDLVYIPDEDMLTKIHGKFMEGGTHGT